MKTDNICDTSHVKYFYFATRYTKFQRFAHNVTQYLLMTVTCFLHVVTDLFEISKCFTLKYVILNKCTKQQAFQALSRRRKDE